MAKVVARSGLAAKLGNSLNQSVDAHKNDETVISAGGLPAGIENGIAQVVDVKFGEYKTGTMKGEYYFMAQAVVTAPATFKDSEGNLHYPKGNRTSIGPEPICATPTRTRKTIDDHIAWVLNELRKMGVDTSNVDGANLEAVCEAVKQAKPHIKFRTWSGKATEAEELSNGQVRVGDKTYPNMAAAKAANRYLGQAPTVQHDWRGITEVDADITEHVLDGVDDNSPEEGGDVAKESQGESEADPAGHLTELGEAADSDDKDAQKKLHQLAKAQGIDPDEVATWSEVAALLINAGTSEGGEAQSAAASEGRPEGWKPVRDEVYFFIPKGKRKPHEGGVTAVFESSQTCNMKSYDDDETYRAVSWDSLKDTKEELA